MSQHQRQVLKRILKLEIIVEFFPGYAAVAVAVDEVEKDAQILELRADDVVFREIALPLRSTWSKLIRGRR